MTQFEVFLVVSVGNMLPCHHLPLHAFGYGEGNVRSKILEEIVLDAEEVEMGKAITLILINIYFASGSEFCVVLREVKCIWESNDFSKSMNI